MQKQNCSVKSCQYLYIYCSHKKLSINHYINNLCFYPFSQFNLFYRWRMISILNKFKLATFLATGLFFLTLRIKEEKKTEKNKEYPHSDLYDNNLTLINITNFKFVINNDICNGQRIALVTIVHSAVDNQEARSMIRPVW